jgi:hypothetical protein
MGLLMLTRRNILCSYATLLLLVAGGEARAATLSLEPTTTVVAAGSLIGVVISGADFPAGTDGGDFSIGWSENLQFVDLTVANPPWDVSAFDASHALSDSFVDYVDVFASVETPGDSGSHFDIATLTLRAVSEGGAYVALGANLVGWSVGGEPIYDLSYGEADLQVVAAPAPSTLPLLALSLGLLFVMRTRWAWRLMR